MYELTSLVSELMPRLPVTGIFSIDSLLKPSSGLTQDTIQWQWRDDRGIWHSYPIPDSRDIEVRRLEYFGI